MLLCLVFRSLEVPPGLTQVLLKFLLLAAFNEKSKVGGTTIPNLKTYYKVTIIKTMVLTWHTYQWHKISSPGTNPHIRGQVIFKNGESGKLKVMLEYFLPCV